MLKTNLINTTTTASLRLWRFKCIGGWYIDKTFSRRCSSKIFPLLILFSLIALITSFLTALITFSSGCCETAWKTFLLSFSPYDYFYH